MRELLNYIISNLISHKDKLDITDVENNGLVTFNVTCDKEDFGRVIGKGGRIIKAIRKVVRMAALASNKKVYLEIKSAE